MSRGFKLDARKLQQLIDKWEGWVAEYTAAGNHAEAKRWAEGIREARELFERRRARLKATGFTGNAETARKARAAKAAKQR